MVFPLPYLVLVENLSCSVSHWSLGILITSLDFVFCSYSCCDIELRPDNSSDVSSVVSHAWFNFQTPPWSLNSSRPKAVTYSSLYIQHQDQSLNYGRYSVIIEQKEKQIWDWNLEETYSKHQLCSILYVNVILCGQAILQ